MWFVSKGEEGMVCESKNIAGGEGLPEWLATFPTGFLIVFACGKLTGTVINGDHMTVEYEANHKSTGCNVLKFVEFVLEIYTHHGKFKQLNKYL